MNSMKKNCKESSTGRQITKWYKTKGRNNLPWRENITPYRVWISEIMLQQTQAKTVVNYFEKFISYYPTFEDFKSASEEDVLSLWKGLGFYRRARNLYRAKEIILKKFNGKLPNSFKNLITLPGIGKSTAGAILSIAYKLPYPILDANVKRVLTRLFFKTNSNEKELWDLSSQILDKKNVDDFQQGIMDLGATVCTPKNPLCGECPLNKQCISFSKGELPTANVKKINKKNVYLEFEIYEKNQKIFLVKNNQLGFWDGLWIMPIAKTKQLKTEIIHKLSHRNLHISFANRSKDELKSEGKWFDIAQLSKLPTPKPISDKLSVYVQNFL